MYDRHVSSDEIGALLVPGVAPAHTSVVADHLFRCADCWNLATEMLGELDVASTPASTAPALAALVDRDPALKALVQRFRLEQGRLKERLIAQFAVGELRSVKRKNRREQIARKRIYRSRAVVEELLSEARRSSEPSEGEEWATLALVACHQLPTTEFSETLRADLLAESCTELASARRRSARWKAAREALREGHEHASRGSRNPSIQGSLLAVEGAIEGDIGSLQDAELTLQRAKACFGAAGETRLAARTLVQLAYIWMDAEPLRSLDYLQDVASFIPSDDKRLFLLAESTRIDCLITLGSNREALRRFVNHAELWDQFADPFFQLRRRFMAGRLLEGFGYFAEADAIFREVIAADLEQRSTKSLFLDLLYLFGSYVRREDWPRAIEVCQDALRQLSVLDLDPDSEEQMRGLWSNLGRHAQKHAVGRVVVEKSRRFIRSQWRMARGDALATKESAI
jgi:tetratricopeptide (TPR) repeat protein